MSLNQLTTNFLEAYKTNNNIASTLFCLQPSHLTMALDLKDTIIRSLITPQNYINGLSFPILCSSITDFSCIVIFSIYYVCVILFRSYVISKLHACTFVTCSLNVIDWLIILLLPVTNFVYMTLCMCVCFGLQCCCQTSSHWRSFSTIRGM